jgi:predicted DNA-binding transcriptional regulator AlpA
MSKRAGANKVPVPSRRLLTIEEAAQYCGIGRESFGVNCPVRPKRVRPGQRGLRYDVRDLDEWIDTLGLAGDVNGLSDERWLAKLDGTDKDQGHQSLRQ